MMSARRGFPVAISARIATLWRPIGIAPPMPANNRATAVPAKAGLGLDLGWQLLRRSKRATTLARVGKNGWQGREYGSFRCGGLRPGRDGERGAPACGAQRQTGAGAGALCARPRPWLLPRPDAHHSTRILRTSLLCPLAAPRLQTVA